MKRTLLFILLFLPTLAIFYGVQAQNVKDGHEYVDLGLPSGLLWATCNIGAEVPNQAGYYFAWGEVGQRDVYDWENYKWGDDKYLTKYNTSGKYGVSDFKKKLDPEDDAAHMIWGGEWRMPTVADAEELKQFCTFWIENGIGYVQGPNGNILTFALTGAQIGNKITTTVYTGPYALYWLSEVRNYDNDPGLRNTDSDAQEAGVLYLRYSANRSLLAKAFAFRYKGCNIRPVCPSSPQENEREINEQNFPDENFRDYVLSTAIDRNQNKVLDDDEILRVKEIDVHYKKIASLKGIEHFKELHKLTCYQNDLTELDLSVCPRLDTLNCAVNKLKALNLSNCSKLKWIRCDQNQLSELDVSACTELELLICSSNKITTLDVSACREIMDFECHYNNLTKLDVSNNKKLVKLYCDYNQLTELDLSKNTKLEMCSCNKNRITKLILSKDNVLNTLNCSTNQLYGAAMDHIVENLSYKQQGGFLYVFNADDKDLENNIITTKQVDVLNAKGWIVYQWVYSAFSIYKGSTPTDDYRPFVEDDKVWKVGAEGSGNPVQWVKYYYFGGDTIIGGKTCKQMMCQQYVNPDYADYDNVMKYPQLSYVGAWYEEDKKVYFCNANNKQLTLWYDFSADANETIQIHNESYVVGPKLTGGIKGFKGVYREVDNSAHSVSKSTWLEGVGNMEAPIYSVYYGKELHAMFLMSCTVGDEVIYLNDVFEDGATPEEARKHRFDFTHTVKTQPKAPASPQTSLRRASGTVREAEQPLYGEYNDLQLGIHLDPLDEAYLVRITDETGTVVYEKAVNAGTIVGLNIDISAYPKGLYTVTVENNRESFTGEIDTRTTGISLTPAFSQGEGAIYNLQGQRISSLQKGLNIVNRRKVFVK